MSPSHSNLRWSAITLLLAALVWVGQLAGAAGQPYATGELAGKGAPGVTHVVESNWASPLRGDLPEWESDPDPLVDTVNQQGPDSARSVLVMAFPDVAPANRTPVTPGIRAPPRFSFFA
ncbi:hypothetical protein F3N42_09725 [Marinihelvus fidelis]|uniref:Uncharacterized protein n=1 Tax=Marinihelvus fidelis TaxID=2613842 RepID=A0A5N0TAX6_9GAMM|nr:hypothetical protein [Marinihelvus fidelis]KAA9131584.1 hypothetical protein F3N42_09725 [Marinihelvus fidelis]